MVPFARQMDWPPTVAEPKVAEPMVAEFAKSWEEETVFEKYPYVEVTAEPVAFVKVSVWREERPLMVRAPEKREVAAKVVMVPEAALTLVAERFVVVTFVVVTFPSTAFQRSVSLPSA